VLVTEHVAATAGFEEVRVQHAVEHHEELRAGFRGPSACLGFPRNNTAGGLVG